MDIFAYELCLLRCLQMCPSVKLETYFCFVLWVVRIQLFHDENRILPVFFIWIDFCKLKNFFDLSSYIFNILYKQNEWMQMLIIEYLNVKKMKLWLTHRAKTLNHQRNKHSCRLAFAKHKTCPCKLTLGKRVQNFCLNSFIYDMLWKNHS